MKIIMLFLLPFTGYAADLPPPSSAPKAITRFQARNAVSVKNTSDNNSEVVMLDTGVCRLTAQLAPKEKLKIDIGSALLIKQYTVSDSGENVEISFHPFKKREIKMNCKFTPGSPNDAEVQVIHEFPGFLAYYANGKPSFAYTNEYKKIYENKKVEPVDFLRPGYNSDSPSELAQ